MFYFLTKNKSLNTLLLINNIFVLAANMFPPIFALFVKEIGGDVLSAGGLWAVFSIVTAILTLIITRYGDRLKEIEYLLAAGYAFRTIAWIGYFFSYSLWQLYVLQFILAIGEALGTPAFNAIYSRHLDKGSFVKQWGINNSFNFFIAGIAALVGGVVVFYLGFRNLFLMMAFLSVVSFVFLLFQPRKLL